MQPSRLIKKKGEKRVKKGEKRVKEVRKEGRRENGGKKNR
jgi:hypothetical protein